MDFDGSLIDFAEQYDVEAYKIITKGLQTARKHNITDQTLPERFKEVATNPKPTGDSELHMSAGEVQTINIIEFLENEGEPIMDLYCACGLNIYAFYLVLTLHFKELNALVAKFGLANPEEDLTSVQI